MSLITIEVMWFVFYLKALQVKKELNLERLRMAGEDFFKFNKSDEFRLSNFKEIKEEDLKGADEKTKKLFNIFAGEDKILQKVEAESLFNVLKSVAGENQIIEENEINAFTEKHFGEVVDISVFETFLNKLFGTNDKPQTTTNQITKNDEVSTSQQALLEDSACKEVALDIISENITDAFEVLNSQYLGSISGSYDEKKDKNDILKTSNVSKVLSYQSAGITWLEKAKLSPPNGLTRKEYYEGNKQRIKDMILTRVFVLGTNTRFNALKSKYSEEELAKIVGNYVEVLCSNASMEDLKDIQKRLVSYSGAEEIKALEKLMDNAVEYNENKKQTHSYNEEPLSIEDMQKGIIPENWDTDEPISFEEVYKIERGTEYSQSKIEKYALAKKEMEIVANAYNKKQQLVEFATGLIKENTLSVNEKAQKVFEGFATFYELSEDRGLSKLKELIQKSKLPISVDENGFNFGALDDSAKNRALNSLLKLAQQSKEAEFKEFLNGKTIEDYQIALAQAHNDAVGEENGKIMAEAMKNDNLTCIQRWTGNTSMVGMGMTIVGGILCFTPLAPLGAGMVTVGNTLAIGGMVAETGLGVTDYATKDVQTAEEAEQLGKNFLMNAGGFIVGIGAGKTAMKAFNSLIDKKLVAVFGKQIAAGNKMQALKTVFTNPEYLKSFMTAAGAKLSIDFVISYAGDLAMMGILDTNDDWRSLLKANLTGILVGMSGDIKDVSGVGSVRNTVNSNKPKPMTELDYGQRLLGNEVKVTDPTTGATVEGTVIGLHNTNGQVEIEVNGHRYSTNDVTQIKDNTEVVKLDKNSDNIKSSKFKHTKTDFKNDDEFMLTVGFSEADIATMRESGVYEMCTLGFHLYERYLPENLSEMVEYIKTELTQKNIEKVEVSEFCMKNFDELASCAENAFKNLDKANFIDMLSEIMIGNGDNVQKKFKVIQEYPKLFENLTKWNSSIDEILDNLANTPDKKLFAKKIECIEKIVPNDNREAWNTVKKIVMSDSFEYKFEVMKYLSEDSNFDGKLDKILQKERNAIEFILKSYDEIKDDPSLVDTILDNLLEVEGNRLDSDISVINLRKRLYKEAGITEKINNYYLRNIAEGVKDDIHIAYIKELYEINKDFTSICTHIKETLGKITDTMQKDICLLAYKYKKLGCMDALLDNIKYDWQLKTAQKIFDNSDITSTSAIKILEKNIDKDIDGYINRHIEDFKNYSFVEKFLSTEPERLKYVLKYDGTMFEDFSKKIPLYKMKVIDKIAEIMEENPDFISSKEQLSGYIDVNIDSELKVKFWIDILSNGEYKNLDSLLSQCGAWFFNSETSIKNIYAMNLFKKPETKHMQPSTLEAFIKYDSEEIVDKILSYHIDERNLVDFCLNFSEITDVAKAQFKFLDDILKVYPDYLQKQIDGLGDSISCPFRTCWSVEEVAVQHKWFNKTELRNKYPREVFVEFIKAINLDNENCIESLLKSSRFKDSGSLTSITKLMKCINKANSDSVMKLVDNEDFSLDGIVNVLRTLSYIGKQGQDYLSELLKNYKEMEIPTDTIAFLVRKQGEISPEQIQKLVRIAGLDCVAKLDDADLELACKLSDLCGITDINEIPIEGKKEILRTLVSCNQGLFDISLEMRKLFPILPTNREAYCSLLPSIVRSLGIETNPLSKAQTTRFNKSVGNLSETLAKTSDADFANLKITQEYPKEEFVEKALRIVDKLPANERQKVFDYFGFEIHGNSQTGFYITGYPVNLNNGKKLAQIDAPATKEIIELLRPEVIKFSEKNSIKCNNPQIEQFLNEIIDALPELRTAIGKKQHITHHFDVFQHSLKVMQKVSQDPKFKTLNESDQKVMMLASLLHDITKREGSVDKTHATESSFDTFFIAKKFNLSREEEIKLYTLTKHHEWLEFVNTSKSEEQLTERLQSVAFDLQNDNLFEMALMFTHADLRAVKSDDTFHDTTVGKSRIAFDGTSRSFGDSADIYAERIQTYIQELKKSQPLLPVTKIPRASKIADAITVVKPDGSTNIKGVYKDKDGLIIIKYNEVEDWEAIGFSKGSISRGVESKKDVDYGATEMLEDVNTGNIKFFAHGLDYENQLAKFDAFGLVDSDALLSISYAERPESKYRFFRAQGVLLDFDTKYVYGGGRSDSGSGRSKNINTFKKQYIFGGGRENDRLYVSNLIKSATGMDDAQYIEFVKANGNKQLSEIEPKELRETLIRAFASINSNVRKGNREYNEMYGSNPKDVMAVFAYNINYDENIGNPVEFLNRTSIVNLEQDGIGKANAKSVVDRTWFLRRYALEHNIPFVVFGD